MRTDKLDKRIIALLVDDGKRSFASIGGEVGLSSPAVKRRVDRLHEAGAIRRFTVEVAPAALGWNAEAFVELNCRLTPQSSIPALVEEMPEIVAAYTVTGDSDALLHIRASDTAHLERTLQRIRQDDNVVRTRSTLVLSAL